MILTAAIFSNLAAQLTSPAVSGDKDLRDDNIRMRSVDLERTKRDAKKSETENSGAASTVLPTAVIKSDIDTKYPQIKEDFEGIQNNQTEIIKTYTTGEKIDYQRIKNLAETLSKMAKRLDGNLFAPQVEKKKEKPKETVTDKKNIKELIIDLDNAIGDFVSSPMFLNLRVIEPRIADKTQFDLAKIIEISQTLFLEEDKTK